MICENCGAEIQQNYGDDHINLCEFCRENHFQVCEHCGRLEVEPTLESVYTRADASRTELWCATCAELYSSVCDHCHYRFSDDLILSDCMGVTVCRECYNDHYFTCTNCSGIEPFDECNWIEEIDEYYCNHCYEERRRNKVIRNYHYKPQPLFHGNGFTFFGVELEMGLCPNPILDVARTVRNLSNDEDLFYLKSDSSIPGAGFELVTHPCTYEYHMKEFPWETICETARKQGLKSHDVPNCACGLHIHVTRTALSEFRWLLLDIFVNKYSEFFTKIARRSSNHYAEFREFTGNMRYFGRFSSSRYRAMNFENSNTVEFRFFRGTLNENTLLATIDIVDSLVAFIKTQNVVSLCSSGVKEYCKFIREHKDKYSNAYSYMLDKFSPSFKIQY